MLEFLFAAALDIQGPWFKPCEEAISQTSIKEELQITADQWIRTTHSYQGTNCSGAENVKVRNVMLASAQEPNLDLKTIATYLEPKSQKAAAAFNANHYCGFSDWKVDSEKNVTGLNCAGSQIPEAGHMIYSIYRLQPREPRDLLWLGEATEHADGSSPENRYLTYELYAFERKP